MSKQIHLTPEAFQIDAQEWCKQIEAFISDMFSRSNRDGIVIPISGGLDSIVVAALCVRAIGKEKVIGLMLPEKLGNPEANLFLLAISGRECWKGIVNWFLQKRNQTAKILYIDA